MNTWNSRLAFAISESEYTPNSFATAVGVAAPTVAAWIGAGNIKPAEHIKSEHMLRACDLLRINPYWLIFNQGAMRAGRAANVTDEMATIIGALIEIDHEGTDEREDVLEIVGRLLRKRLAAHGLTHKIKRLP
ncbi:hypothetical protein [Burkholderia pseudomallei]|uniref:hypothetical protein n=1 Tax=Burkholderia pseudomallei TaxID=28450 RepID=UPI00100A79B1|nr:hypothetical protein [Burkholderia pseudomallei]